MIEQQWVGPPELLSGQEITYHILRCSECVIRPSGRQLEPLVWLCADGRRIADQARTTGQGEGEV